MEPILTSLSTLSFASAVLAATYLIRRTNHDPNPPNASSTSTTKTQPIRLPKNDFLMAAGFKLTIARHVNPITVLGISHAIFACLSDPLRPAVCPNYTTGRVNAGFFTWAKYTTTALVILIFACLLRLRAYTNLGSSFTYNITKPAGLITTGVHHYIRHPSYTALFITAVAMIMLFFRAGGLIGCWLSPSLANGLEKAMMVWGGALMPAVFWLRVQEEEMFLGEIFGGEWEEYRVRTRLFIPWVF